VPMRLTLTSVVCMKTEDRSFVLGIISMRHAPSRLPHSVDTSHSQREPAGRRSVDGVAREHHSPQLDNHDDTQLDNHDELQKLAVGRTCRGISATFFDMFTQAVCELAEASAPTDWRYVVRPSLCVTVRLALASRYQSTHHRTARPAVHTRLS
jgi:hypothetical protein